MSYSRHIESIDSIVAAPPVAFIGDENALRRGCGASDVSNFAQTPDGQRRNPNINRYAIAKRSVFISTY